VEEQVKTEENWGVLEPLRGVLVPIVEMVKPVTMQVIVGVLCVMVLWMWVRGPSASSIGPYAGLKHKDRVAAYEEMWMREEKNGGGVERWKVRAEEAKEGEAAGSQGEGGRGEVEGGENE
ncbi:MAG: hypothetical protein M1823_008426, partial [Watsoniomyces obsoletus]